MNNASQKFFDHKEPYLNIKQVLNAEKRKQALLK